MNTCIRDFLRCIPSPTRSSHWVVTHIGMLLLAHMRQIKATTTRSGNVNAGQNLFHYRVECEVAVPTHLNTLALEPHRNTCRDGAINHHILVRIPFGIQLDELTEVCLVLPNVEESNLVETNIESGSAATAVKYMLSFETTYPTKQGLSAITVIDKVNMDTRVRCQLFWRQKSIEFEGFTSRPPCGKGLKYTATTNWIQFCKIAFAVYINLDEESWH